MIIHTKEQKPTVIKQLFNTLGNANCYANVSIHGQFIDEWKKVNQNNMLKETISFDLGNILTKQITKLIKSLPTINSNSNNDLEYKIQKDISRIASLLVDCGLQMLSMISITLDSTQALQYSNHVVLINTPKFSASIDRPCDSKDIIMLQVNIANFNVLVGFCHMLLMNPLLIQMLDNQIQNKQILMQIDNIRSQLIEQYKDVLHNLIDFINKYSNEELDLKIEITLSSTKEEYERYKSKIIPHTLEEQQKNLENDDSKMQPLQSVVAIMSALESENTNNIND